MVARARTQRRRPVVHMHMLDRELAAAHDRVRDEEVVELLAVLVEEVRVALDERHVRRDVELGEEPVERREHGARLHVLVAVAADEDARVRVKREERLDERLVDGPLRISGGAQL